jgi:succinate dehydrogenase / fumarate reductase, cytochrome b subunit
MAEGSRAIRGRPMSPHLQIWRWHITMATSILHRATGVALYGAALLAAWWAVALASGPDAYADFMAIAGGWLGKLVLIGLLVSTFYHLANGIRHLVWDLGHGLDIKSANASAVVVFAFTVAASVAVLAIAFMTGVF